MYMLNNINNYILLILINTMGRGAAAAHAAYNGSGTQGISVTNEINENEDIHSVFITQNDTSKQILHGHNISEMTCSGKKTGSIESERYKIFTPGENIDMLGDIYLNFEMDSEISNFEFVDSEEVSYPLLGLQQNDLTTNFTAGGAETKAMKLDLTTREVPAIEQDELKHFYIINKIKTFKYSDRTVQFAVGKGYYNIAWRYYDWIVPNGFSFWYYLNIPDFIEINDIIHDPLFNEPGATGDSNFGSFIFGGNLQTSLRGVRSGLCFITIVDIIRYEKVDAVARSHSSWQSIIKELSIPLLNQYPAEYTQDPTPYTAYMHFITVNNLTYLSGATGFIASGRKNYDKDELEVIIPEINEQSLNSSVDTDAQTQTSVLFLNDESNYFRYIRRDMKFDLIHNGADDRHKFSSNPDITSSLNITDSGETVLSCGSRYNTLLALDTSGLIIKSYDNGMTWENVEFYYGSQQSVENSEKGGSIIDVPSNKITNTTGGYVVNDIVNFVQAEAHSGKGQILTVSETGGNVQSVKIISGGFGYTTKTVTLVRERDGSGDTTCIPDVFGSIRGLSDPSTSSKPGSGYALKDIVRLKQDGIPINDQGTAIITQVDSGGGVVSLDILTGGKGYISGTNVELVKDGPSGVFAELTIDEIGFYRESAAYDYLTRTNKTFDKGIYIDKTFQDSNFKYFMPKVSQLHTNNSGVWTAIGQQGIQPKTTTVISDRYRQFVFRSIDDGENWHPVRVYAYPNKRELNHAKFNSIHVDYKSIYTTDIEACKILMSVPPGVSMDSELPYGDSSKAHWGVEPHIDLAVSNADAVPGESYVLLNLPCTLKLPWLGSAYSFPSASHAAKRSTFHRVTPWFGQPTDSNNSGLYKIENLNSGNDFTSVSQFNYEYIGAISDDKRDFLFGKYNKSINGQNQDIGIVTILPIKGSLAEPRALTSRTSAYYLLPIEPITIELGIDKIINKIVKTSSGIIAVLKNNNYKYYYEITQSYEGIYWTKLQDIYDSPTVPMIQSDKTGNIIFSYKTYYEDEYRIFKITSEGEYSEINVLKNIFTDITSLNYAGTEWIIAGKFGNNTIIVRSYDTINWRKPKININIYPVISSIVVKEKRLYETLVKLNINTGETEHFKKGNFRTYEVCHSDERNDWQGLGVRAYNLPSLNFSAGITLTNEQTIKINTIDVPVNSYSTPVANDILQIQDGTIILCGENKHLYNINQYYTVYAANNYNDYVNLAEGPGADGLTFTEVRTIYKSLAGDYMGITNLANSFQSLHKVHFSEFNHLAIGKHWYGNGVPNARYGIIYEMSQAGVNIDGILALRHIPDPNEFTGLTQTYYWKFVFGTNDPSINNSTTDDWTITPFETIHDVYTNNLREIVVVGKPKSGNSPIYYERPDNLSLKTFRNEWTKISADYHGFSEVLSVCYTGTRWVFVGIPNNLVQNDGKILAHTTDLLDPDKWVIENFSDIDKTPFNVNKETDVTNNTFESTFTKVPFTNVSTWQGNHVRPVNYKEKSCVIINVSFYDDTSGIQTYDRLQEKVYFMYDEDGIISIKQNKSYPQPKLSYRDLIGGSTYETNAHGGEQFRPTWETYIDGSLRTVFTTVYPSDFNQFLVDLDGEDFILRLYSNPLTEDSFANLGKYWQRRYRKFITINTFSLNNRIDGNCYKIERVKNENFVSGVDSVRYLAVGKGVTSPLVQSDDLINWYDVNVKDIFTIIFDIFHKSGLWIAIGEGNYNLAISKDGKNWTGIYTRYQSDTLSIEYTTTFNSLDYFDISNVFPVDSNIVDILPYVPELKGIFLKNLSLLRLFSRIEYHVGTQIWQTLTFDDIKAMLDTEFGSGEYRNLLKNCSVINKNGSTRLTTWIPGFTKTLNSKLETFVNVSENGSFPNGLLKDQKLSIKIYYNKIDNVIGNELTSSDMNSDVFDNLIRNTLIPTDRDANYYIDSFLADNYGFQLGDTYRNVNGRFVLNYNTKIKNLRLYSKNFELDDIEINEFNKGVKQVPKITQSLYFDANNTSNLILDLDSFDLYASHIIVSGWLTSDVYIKNMDLELNGYSYQKIMEPSIIDFSTKSYLGLNYNKFIFNGIDKEDGIGSLVIPLASTAYSGSSVPLDRYNSIRLKIVFNTIAGPYSYINVTCVGTTTVSYNNNTANIDLY